MSVNHIILLTDGQTYGDEKACLEEAEWAGSHQIHLSTIGIGTDWNEELLDQMAVRSGGGSVYIDKPEKVQNIFNETMENLETVVARELTLMINPRVEVRLQEAYQVTPHICRLEVHDHKIMLGPLSSTLEKSVLMEFRIRELPPGEQQLLRITVEADVPGRAKGHSWDWSELMVDVSEQKALNPNIPQLILAALSNLSVYKMQEKVASDLKVGQIQRATQRLQIMATQLFNMGEPELAQIASLEADQLTRTSMLSPEGSKKIRYGTRVLNSKDTTMLTTRLAQLTQNLQLEPRERSSS
jgi:Ca-activated chloride channel family protein